DVFVVKGVSKRYRRVYKLWEEGKAPSVVIEVSSRKTKHEDLGEKFEVYQGILKVKEYYIYDPLREYLPTRLRAWDRKGGRFVERRLVRGRAASAELGLELVDHDGRLRLLDPATGEELPDLQEADQLRRAEAEGRRQEAEGRRVEAEGRRLEAEGRRQEAEGRRLEAEARRQAEAEVVRLREELARARRTERTQYRSTEVGDQ
ncbi:MAG: Uma2 family endonuclease, partial [Planctomycetes bacterium]|nr:Uma2 family endonuclease [Planctomycetota bacterium]